MAFLLAGGPRFFVLASFPALPVVLASLGLFAVTAGAINPILSTVEYERVPTGMRGRVFGAITAGVFCAIPLGGLLAGRPVGVGGAADHAGRPRHRLPDRDANPAGGAGVATDGRHDAGSDDRVIKALVGVQATLPTATRIRRRRSSELIPRRARTRVATPRPSLSKPSNTCSVPM